MGTPYIQAATTLHELGHNADLYHGGMSPKWGDTTTATYVEPNCKPNYLSVMSYLFQAHGLFTDLSALPQVDYSSSGDYGSLNELSLADGFLNAPLPYRTSWFAPLLPSMTAATKIPAH